MPVTDEFIPRDENDMTRVAKKKAPARSFSRPRHPRLRSDTEMSTGRIVHQHPRGLRYPDRLGPYPQPRPQRHHHRPAGLDPAPTLPATGSTTARYTSRWRITAVRHISCGDRDRETARATSTCRLPRPPMPTSQPTRMHRHRLLLNHIAFLSLAVPSALYQTTHPLLIGSTDATSSSMMLWVKVMGCGGVGVEGVEDGIVSLEPNRRTFAMGATPGCPCAIAIDEGRRMERDITRRKVDAGGCDSCTGR
ncbi:hypothetical protein Hypma_004871 [Hypsizygus marmoreus]|uniref:Uncharacterized protein n=1 Tax=Hypsizygus marmoreus TaxID=39966 RepID=A0A369IZI7_HYPMA|nr:hypothetical protein Hypma_004871 [Hypsizygus marmoreus]